jgi:hypothetical protein
MRERCGIAGVKGPLGGPTNTHILETKRIQDQIHQLWIKIKLTAN